MSFPTLFSCLLVLLLFPNLSFAQTDAQLRGGIVINEVLPDPNSSTENVDTDGDGSASATDEFVELFNDSDSEIQIGGLQLWDPGSDRWFTVPENETLPSESFAVVVIGVQSGGALPDVGGGNVAFDAGSGAGVLNNGGDNVVLFDPKNDEYIQVLYGGDSQRDPTNTSSSDFDGFSSSATRVGSVDDFQEDTDGVSRVRDPAGATSVVDHNSVTSENASPGRQGNIALPVEIAVFEASVADDRVHLSWKTSSETNNVGFRVEHRGPGVGEWTERGFVQGAGTTTEERSYQFVTDTLPGGTHRFRLEQVDTDGTVHLSAVQTVQVRPDAGLTLQSPNPITLGQTASVLIEAESKQVVDVALYDVLGQRVRTIGKQQVVPERPLRKRLSTADLSSGLYVLEVRGESFRAAETLSVVR